MGTGRGGSAVVLSVLMVLMLAACGGGGMPDVIRRPSATAPRPAPTLATTLPPSRYQVVFQAGVAYGPWPEEQLDLCLPEGAPGMAHPGVILIHGGGWTNGDKGEFAQQCQYLASLGFVTAAVNYRLAPAHRWPAQLVDTQLAVRFLRGHAGQFHLDARHLCAWGTSSGAHLAVFLGVLARIHPGDEADGYADQPVQVACVVDEFGPVDLTTYGKTKDQMGLLQLLLGGATPQSDPQLYQDASPVFAVTDQSAAMLIVQGTADTVVPADQSRELEQALQQHGQMPPFISYPGEHGFGGLSGDQVQVIRAQEVSFLVAYGGAPAALASFEPSAREM